jgi:hypothetical protein
MWLLTSRSRYFPIHSYMDAWGKAILFNGIQRTHRVEVARYRKQGGLAASGVRWLQQVAGSACVCFIDQVEESGVVIERDGGCVEKARRRTELRKSDACEAV